MEITQRFVWHSTAKAIHKMGIKVRLPKKAHDAFARQFERLAFRQYTRAKEFNKTYRPVSKMRLEIIKPIDDAFVDKIAF